jgi:hypothetical protein
MHFVSALGTFGGSIHIHTLETYSSSPRRESTAENISISFVIYNLFCSTDATEKPDTAAGFPIWRGYGPWLSERTAKPGALECLIETQGVARFLQAGVTYGQLLI